MTIKNDNDAILNLNERSIHEMDVKGLICPEPVMLLHKMIKSIDSGEVIHIVATDPSTQRDIPRFCEFLSHPLLKQSVSNQTNQLELFEYWIQKR